MNYTHLIAYYAKERLNDSAIITNMVFAFYQMSLVDWSQYR